MTGLQITDAERVISAFNLSDLFENRDQFVADYKDVLGLPKEKSVFKIGPQDINVTAAVDRDFESLNASERQRVKAFYDSVDESSRKFKVLRKGPSGETEAVSRSQYPNIFLGDKIENVVDENGKSLEPGWLWQRGLSFEKGDAIKAMRLLSYRGVEPDQRFFDTGHSIVIVSASQDAANSPDSLWISLPQSLQ